MMYDQIIKKMLLFLLVFILLGSMLSVSDNTFDSKIGSDIELPDPLEVNMVLETSMFRRMSVREFTDTAVTDEELSTVLWAAYGLRSDGSHTVSPINEQHAAIIYVFNENGLYSFDAINHELDLYLEGDHRDEIDILQYEAPIQLALCWNSSTADPNQAGVELGEIGQNIQFMANAIGLGTVVTGQIPPAVDPVSLPEHHEGMILMPLGHPEISYDFTNRPLWFSLLPKIKESETTLSDALNEFKQHDDFDEALSDEQVSQILWSTYGFSPFIDKSEQEPIHLKRHRTVPSAHGYYPLNIYAVTEEGVYQYYPNLLTDVIIPFLGLSSAQVDVIGLPIVPHLKRIDTTDVRSEIAQSCNIPAISSASLVIIPSLDLDKAKELSIESARRFWYYEAGAVAQNVLLEAEAWDLSSRIVYPVAAEEVRLILGLEDTIIPQMILPLGS